MFILEKVSGLGHHLTQGGNGTGFGVPVQGLPVTGVVTSQMSFLSGPHLFHLWVEEPRLLEPPGQTVQCVYSEVSTMPGMQGVLRAQSSKTINSHQGLEGEGVGGGGGGGGGGTAY